MKRANSIIQTQVMPDDVIRFVVAGAGELALDMAKLHGDNQRHAAIHGMIQRISDAAAISRDPKTGRPATPEEKLEAMRRLVEHYESGAAEWSRVRESAGPRGGFLFEALCRMYPAKPPADIRAYLDGLSDKQQSALREDDAVGPVISAIKAERNAGQPKPDTKAMLAGLQ